MKKMVFYTMLCGVMIPDVIWWGFHVPQLLCTALYSMLCHRENRYFARLKILSVLRRACRFYAEKEKKSTAVIDCKYRYTPSGISVKMRFNRKAVTNQYEEFREFVMLHAGIVSNLEMRRGWAYFDVLVHLDAAETIRGDHHQCVIGTGIRDLIDWNWVQYPHLLCVADTGQGKSSFIRYLLSNLFAGGNAVWLVDGKAIDYYQYASYFERYLSNDGSQEATQRIVQMLDAFVEDMNERKKKIMAAGVSSFADVPGMRPKFLVLEEYAVIITKMDKRLREAFEKKLEDVIFLGRACGSNVILTIQRGDTAYIKGALRDNMMCRLLLGSATDASARMMFEEAVQNLGIGECWVQMGKERQYMRIPYFSSIVMPERFTWIRENEGSQEAAAPAG